MKIQRMVQGIPCWFELASRDPEASAAFHVAVFDWDHRRMDLGAMGAYHFFRNRTGTVGALRNLSPAETAAGMPAAWTIYFAVTDLERAAAQVPALGGRILMGPHEVTDQGRMLRIADPTGAACCLWQPTAGSAGDFTMMEPNSVGWVELATRDAEAARQFYDELLGWHWQRSTLSGPVPYDEILIEGERYGGMMPMTAEWGDLLSHWSIYWVVADLDAALAACMAHGGSIPVPAFAVPGLGRIARIDEPGGAGAYLIQLEAQGAAR
ncbi:MAG: VOC family protein [Xanthomonadales bacterium]|jgi:hypothetical protein|nr:VOC family protein [Xanthomonadales bacterium]